MFWTETEFEDPTKNETVTISNGLLSRCEVGGNPEWHPGHRQGVYFLPFEIIGNVKKVEVSIEQREGDLEFKFNVF